MEDFEASFSKTDGCLGKILKEVLEIWMQIDRSVEKTRMKGIWTQFFSCLFVSEVFKNLLMDAAFAAIMHIVMVWNFVSPSQFHNHLQS